MRRKFNFALGLHGPERENDGSREIVLLGCEAGGAREQDRRLGHERIRGKIAESESL